jgi:hypothetical protein
MRTQLALHIGFYRIHWSDINMYNLGCSDFDFFSHFEV